MIPARLRCSSRRAVRAGVDEADDRAVARARAPGRSPRPRRDRFRYDPEWADNRLDLQSYDVGGRTRVADSMTCGTCRPRTPARFRSTRRTEDIEHSSGARNPPEDAGRLRSRTSSASVSFPVSLRLPAPERVSRSTVRIRPATATATMATTRPARRLMRRRQDRSIWRSPASSGRGHDGPDRSSGR